MQYEVHCYGYAMNDKQYFIASKEAAYKSLSLTFSHLPSGLNQCRKFLQRGDIYFLKAKRAYKKTQLTVKLDKSGFWTFWTLKLTNIETRF